MNEYSEEAKLIAEREVAALYERLDLRNAPEEAGAFFCVVPRAEIPYCDVFAFLGSRMVFGTRGTVGRNGVALSRREGDGTTPAGIFTLSDCFGICPKPDNMRLPYLELNGHYYWNSDRNCGPYNALVDDREMPENWVSQGSEHLIRYAVSYNYACSVNYNVNPYVKGIGTSIFFHCVNSSFTGTAGCVGVPEDKMIQALQVMGPESRMIILRNQGTNGDD